MQILLETFLSNLNLVKAGLSPREFIEQSSCFVFQDKQVMTFNDEVACRKAIGIDLQGAVQAASLLAILEKLDDDDLMITDDGNGELEFKGRRKRFGVTKDQEIFLPIDRVEVPKKWMPVPPEFTQAIGLVQHCVSTDESRFLLTCIHLHPDYIEACDNHQVMRVKVKTGLESSILVRGTSLAHLTTLAMDQMSRTKCWLHFKNQAELVFSCRLYAEEYPSLDKILKIDGYPIAMPKGVTKASERAAVFASDKSGDTLMSVTLSDGRMKIRGEGLSGWYQETKKVAYTGPLLEFLIAPELLKYISEHYSEATVADTKLKAVLDKKWEYVSVLGRPNEKKKGKKEAAEEAAEEDTPKKKKKRDAE